ncbi:acireductone synthase [Actinomadura alba]|uniref:Enolase-phosphatase E1 n=1 Tax=Actinomadura alba TaxID=406431 RepID=A0ABR7LNC6_9ACTN|nr:acireductone synthase [Actinomadura alba]MBC6465987.1 acireductone synthase [Actinomadura alba]
MSDPLTIVVDIEGTTGATGFVVDRLYPYSRERFAAWIDTHAGDPEVTRAVAQVRDALGEPDAGTDRVVRALNDWLDRDEKATPLKTLQGGIWAAGFASGELTSHFFPDVIPVLRTWHAAGHPMYVYSSGSVSAQLAWFGNSPEGDLLPLFEGHFDTENAGPKRVAASYEKIAGAIGAAPDRIVFLSDLAAELDAARAAGWRTIGVRRPGEPHYDRGVGNHPEVATFDQADRMLQQ